MRCVIGPFAVPNSTMRKSCINRRGLLGIAASFNGITYAGRAFVVFFFNDVGEPFFQFSQRILGVGIFFIASFIIGPVSGSSGTVRVIKTEQPV